MNSSEVINKAKQAGRLLAQSHLDERLKNNILDNLEKLTEQDIDALIQALSREQREIEAIMRDLQAIALVGQEELSKKQQRKTEQLISEFVAELKGEETNHSNRH